jgi:hypothetical protein
MGLWEDDQGNEKGVVICKFANESWMAGIIKSTNTYPHFQSHVQKIYTSAYPLICTLYYLYQSIIFIANNE